MTRNCGLVLIIASMFICTSCDQISHKVTEMTANAIKPVIPPPLKPGQVLDPNSNYAKYWTGLPYWIQFDDVMTLKIPQQFVTFWITPPEGEKVEILQSAVRPKKIRQAQGIGFNMFMPNFEGYTPDNYEDEFDENIVKIISIEAAPMSEAEPDAPGSFPPNMFKRLSEVPSLLDINKYEDKYGLRCYASSKNIPEGVGFSQLCYGKRDEQLDEYILLDVSIPPHSDWQKNPLMRTTYFTKQYGGLRITWWANAKHFSRWHDIDQQIWQYLKEWNVAKIDVIPTNNFSINH